jgi:hypothetical protein
VEGGVMASTVFDSASLEAALPELALSFADVLPVLASRSALRVLPLLGRRGNLTWSQIARLLLAGLRRNLIARTQLVKFADLEIAVVLASLSTEADKAAVEALNASSLAARSLVSPTTDSASKAVYIAYDNPFSDFTKAADIWQQIGRDVELLRQSGRALELSQLPIWTLTPMWWDEAVADFRVLLSSNEMAEMADLSAAKDLFSVPDMRGLGFRFWLDWYDAVAKGSPAFGLNNRETAEALELAIARGGKDGVSHKEFWEREPREINADVAAWVAEARALECLREGQGSGLKFRLHDKFIRPFTAIGLAAPSSDHKRINAQLPILREVVGNLTKRVSGATFEDDPLLTELQGLQRSISLDTAEVDPNMLFARSTNLRRYIANAKASVGNGYLSNHFVLKDGDLAQAEGIVIGCDMLVLATPEGQGLFDDADRLSVDAGPSDGLLERERELLDLLAGQGSIVDPAALKLLKELLLSCKDAEHPVRALHFTRGSVTNLMLVSVGLPLVISAAKTLGPLIVPALVAMLYKSDSEAVKRVKTEVGVKIDKFAAEILLPHEKAIRAWAQAQPRSRQVVLDLLDILKRANEK